MFHGGVYFVKSLFSGFLAGICISIGCNVYLSSSKFIGAVLFSVALLMICFMGLQLYTGKIGFVVQNHAKKDIINLIMCLIGNVFGVCFIGFMPFQLDNKTLIDMCNQKLLQEWYMILLNAFMCGILMYVAVYIFKNKKSIAGIIFCIPTFIICGFEHVVADIYYFCAAKMINKESLVFILIVLLGNTFGSIAFSCIHEFVLDECLLNVDNN